MSTSTLTNVYLPLGKLLELSSLPLIFNTFGLKQNLKKDDNFMLLYNVNRREIRVSILSNEKEVDLDKLVYVHNTTNRLTESAISS